MLWRSARWTKEAKGIDGPRQQDDDRRHYPVMVAEPVCRGAAGREQKVMPQADVIALGLDRLRQEMCHETREQHHRNPVKSRFHSPPCNPKRSVLELWTETASGSYRFLKQVQWRLMLLSVLTVGACTDSAPKGQVVAVVNGAEITVAEINEEARARDLQVESDPSLRNAVIQELVERKLLAAEARAQGLEQTPHFVLAERRLREILLAQQLLAGPQQSAPVSRQQAQAFITANPLAFADRVLARADQLAFFAALDAGLRTKLRAADSVKEMAEHLLAAGIPARRSTETWDSADFDSPLARGEAAPMTGSRFLIQRNGASIIGIVASVTPQPVPPDEQIAFARALLSRFGTERRMRMLVNKARASAKITHQRGFEPETGDPRAAGPSRP